MLPETDKYTYRILWSEEDGEFVGLCAEFPSLSWLAATSEKALKGILTAVNGCVLDMNKNKEALPLPEKSLTIRDIQTHELYASIGEFIVKFEHVCHAMQTTITFIIHGQGLKNQRVANILLAGYTADPLRTLLESLIGETVDLNNNEKNIIKNIFSRIQKITEKRNDIVHSTWFIGWGNETTQDYTDAPGHKLHKNKQGAALKAFNYKSDNFSEFVEEAEKLSSLVLRLHGCITSGFSIEKNFKVKDGIVVDKNG